MPLQDAIQELLRSADQAELDAAAAEQAGDVAGALRLAKHALQFRRIAAQVAATTTLHDQGRTGTVGGVVLSPEHRENISKSRRSDEFAQVMRKRGFPTFKVLARAVGMSPQALGQSRLEPNDPNFRAISANHAAHIEKLIGWPRHRWPRIRD